MDVSNIELEIRELVDRIHMVDQIMRENETNTNDPVQKSQFKITPPDPTLLKMIIQSNYWFATSYEMLEIPDIAENFVANRDRYMHNLSRMILQRIENSTPEELTQLVSQFAISSLISSAQLDQAISNIQTDEIELVNLQESISNVPALDPEEYSADVIR